MSEFEGSPATWPPLGLPVGSVRALLTLIVVAVVVVNIARGDDVDVLWVETLLIALAHYFATRRFVSLPPEVLKKLEQEGVIEKEWQPLFLPRHTIRVLVVAAFVSLAVYLYRENRLFEPRALSFLAVVFAYLLGCLVRGVKDRFIRRSWRPSHWLWRDAGAVTVLVMVLVAAVPEFLGIAGDLHPDVRKAAMGLMLFYFGSR